MIEVSKTNLDGVLVIKSSVFEDFRGQYIETYNEELYRKHGIDAKFVQRYNFYRSTRIAQYANYLSPDKTGASRHQHIFSFEIF